MSVLPPAAMALQSNLQAIASGKRDHHCRQQRKSWRSATPTAPGVVLPTSASPRPLTALFLETVLTRVFEAFLFMSALAIAAYNYWAGELTATATPRQAAAVERTKTGSHHYYYGDTIEAGGERVLDIRQWRQAHPHHQQSLPPMDKLQDRALLEDSKRRRTLLWAENVAQTMAAIDEPLTVSTSISSSSSSSSSKTTSNGRSHSRQRQRRFGALAQPSIAAVDSSRDNTIQENEEEDEMLARMEEQLQSLITQGQAALTSRVTDMEPMDESEMVMRKSFVSGEAEGGSITRPKP